MSAAEDLYRQALALPEDERRELVERIASSLRQAVEPLTGEQVAELNRRLAEVEAGAPTIDEAAFRAHAAARYGIR